MFGSIAPEDGRTAGTLVGHLQEEEVCELLDVVEGRDAGVAEQFAVRPEAVDEGGGRDGGRRGSLGLALGSGHAGVAAPGADSASTLAELSEAGVSVLLLMIVLTGKCVLGTGRNRPAGVSGAAGDALRRARSLLAGLMSAAR